MDRYSNKLLEVELLDVMWYCNGLLLKKTRRRAPRKKCIKSSTIAMKLVPAALIVITTMSAIRNGLVLAELIQVTPF